jgi:replicative DNA helicase
MNIADQIELESRLANYEGEDRVLPATKVLQIHFNERPATEPYKTKIPLLDKIITGLYQGQLIVISGITGHGKTTFAQTLTMSLAEQAALPLWFSYEVDTPDFLSVFPVDMPNYIYMPTKMKDNTHKWIEERIVEAKVKYDIKVVFVDHLHYLVSMNPKQNASYMIGETVRGLKQLALSHNIIMVLIAHMQKTRNDEEPGLGHIRDSSFVEQEADTVFYVWRPKEDRTSTILKIAKNRKRGIIDERIFLTLSGGRFFQRAVQE